MRADDPFQSGMDLAEELADPVRGGRRLLGQVIVETAEHRQFGGLFVGDGDRAQGVRHGAGVFSEL
jgi:hypothetical protein